MNHFSEICDCMIVSHMVNLFQIMSPFQRNSNIRYGLKISTCFLLHLILLDIFGVWGMDGQSSRRSQQTSEDVKFSFRHLCSAVHVTLYMWCTIYSNISFGFRNSHVAQVQRKQQALCKPPKITSRVILECD